MLSQIVFIAFFLAVCMRNSESKEATQHYCANDQNVVDKLKDFEKGIVPIVIIKNSNPMDTSHEFKTFINTHYDNLIVVNNNNNTCPCTEEVLNHGLKNIPAYPYPALFMMNEGQLVTRHRVCEFVPYNLGPLKESATNYRRSTRGRTSNSLMQNIINAINKAVKHPGILTVPLVRNPIGNSSIMSRMKPGPMSFGPLYAMISQRSQDQGQSSKSSPIVRYPNTQMMKPVAMYPTRDTPEELDLLRTMENGEGGSPRTPSMTHAWDYLSRPDPKKRRLDEGPSERRQSP